jgi:hypothetical protein
MLVHDTGCGKKKQETEAVGLDWLGVAIAADFCEKHLGWIFLARNIPCGLR